MLEDGHCGPPYILSFQASPESIVQMDRGEFPQKNMDVS